MLRQGAGPVRAIAVMQHYQPVAVQVYYIPAGDVGLNTGGFVPLQASDAGSVLTDHYDDYDACDVCMPPVQTWRLISVAVPSLHCLR